ncbi:sigmaY antisigma factor component [Alkalihalobacillus sp. LMS39]|uniref:sigmaY antisigma factor component n=1 Tax=Alkalihalobacillus sp. LMS39 TaxID=2924032 RepID=UPI00243728A6|nr:sigmaY antisigma factor component [Alkalihalobacillus sp. LMS39]
MNVKPEDMPIYFWIGIALVLLAQSTWLFIDARRRGHHRWFWGIWGLIHFPSPLLFYLLWSRFFKEKFFSKRRRS